MVRITSQHLNVTTPYAPDIINNVVIPTKMAENNANAQSPTALFVIIGIIGVFLASKLFQ